MIHVICSLWGKKYSVEYVNRLYSMVNRHLPTEFRFYCQTDITNGLNAKIEVLPFLEELPESTPEDMLNSEEFVNNLPRLWDRPKLNYFKPDPWGIKGTKIALDVDLIIHNDMTDILEMFSDKPITGRSWWHDRDKEKQPQWKKRNGAYTNGGFYMWEGNMFESVWKDLKENARKIYFIYTGGSDNFLSQRHYNIFDFLQPGMLYSFNYGCNWPDDLFTYKIRQDGIMCIFNTTGNVKTNLEIHDAIKLFDEVKKLWV
tara:strand:- start:752 stop:1525 length:774 start_codon:yes stop_codon:yes gene_type:complete